MFKKIWQFLVGLFTNDDTLQPFAARILYRIGSEPRYAWVRSFWTGQDWSDVKGGPLDRIQGVNAVEENSNYSVPSGAIVHLRKVGARHLFTYDPNQDLVK